MDQPLESSARQNPLNPKIRLIRDSNNAQNSSTPNRLLRDSKVFHKFVNMKSMTCKQLGGACDKVFQGDTFEQVAEMSQKHGMEMFQAKDEDHMKAMDEMRELMKSPDKMQIWFVDKKQEFDNLPED